MQLQTSPRDRPFEPAFLPNFFLSLLAFFHHSDIILHGLVFYTTPREGRRPSHTHTHTHAHTRRTRSFLDYT